MAHQLKSAFHSQRLSLPVDRLVSSRTFDARERKNEKYQQIAASVGAVGIIEPLIVFPLPKSEYRILDGHKRHDVLLQSGATEVPCIIATDDENYTYNRRANYLSPVAEHHMILRALRHTSEERIAAALNLNIATIRQKRDLLNGICKEAASILKDRRISARTFAVLKKMKPLRQVEAAQLMVASNVHSERFALSLLAGTNDEMLSVPARNGPTKNLGSEQRMQLERETANLLRDLKMVEASYGTDVLTLTVSLRYLSKVFENQRVLTVLRSHHPDALNELAVLLSEAASDSSLP